MIDYLQESLDSFEDSEHKKFIIDIVSMFHYRDLCTYQDGSIGSIKISPKQFRDILAYTIKEANNES